MIDETELVNYLKRQRVRFYAERNMDHFMPIIGLFDEILEIINKSKIGDD
jgi:hypothetical protein